jgi:hypothetical protein
MNQRSRHDPGVFGSHYLLTKFQIIHSKSPGHLSQLLPHYLYLKLIEAFPRRPSTLDHFYQYHPFTANCFKFVQNSSALSLPTLFSSFHPVHLEWQSDRVGYHQKCQLKHQINLLYPIEHIHRLQFAF